MKYPHISCLIMLKTMINYNKILLLNLMKYSHMSYLIMKKKKKIFKNKVKNKLE